MNNVSKKMSSFAISALFRSLEGSWTFQRQITSRLEGSPSGQVDGTATFSRIPLPTATEADGQSQGNQDDYLYSEVGTMMLVDSKQQNFEVRNKYVWSYNSMNDQLGVYFEESGSRANLFNMLRFLPTSSDEETPVEFEKLVGWRANSDHLCGEDNYKSDYLFQFDQDGSRLKRMDIVYNVIGPRKDYTSAATYFPNCLLSS